MILDPEQWMDIRRFRVLADAGSSISEIARETGYDWKTVKKYLAADAATTPPSAPPRAGTQPRLIAPFVAVIEAWLRSDVTLKASVVHERLVAQYAFTGHYQRVKMFVAEARPRIAAEFEACDENPLRGLHRRFEVVPGAQPRATRFVFLIFRLRFSVGPLLTPGWVNAATSSSRQACRVRPRRASSGIGQVRSAAKEREQAAYDRDAADTDRSLT